MLGGSNAVAECLLTNWKSNELKGKTDKHWDFYMKDVWANMLRAINVLSQK
jgi:hypothetical protein